MAVEMLYFAWVREAVGRGGETIEPPAEVVTVADLLDWLGGHSRPHAAAFADRGRLRAAVDQRFAPLDAPIAGAREIAIFPPVTGG
ncbi:molybdopterin converting factor subunit 1 [Sphingomonas cannabina]|uniref:molybdopterin converting factor subunit 1 n=1 Tax=Sphingomonas cannabina TaxID=2899123 RepID=UPI001F164A1F|nr:molybdopterin converting factor subunit 1 [Sphingomonas cannabina]UIJ46848.1 molybdopterin converting factor subunit 1 [Sphingomonas cannabina]